jgi:hypothetical protein
MSETTITVMVGWSRRPVTPDARLSFVIVPLHIEDVGDPASVRTAVSHATLEAYGMVFARIQHTGGGVITSMRVVGETI